MGLCPAAKASGRLLFSNSSVNQITSEIGQENCLEFDQIIKKGMAIDFGFFRIKFMMMMMMISDKPFQLRHGY